jgi:hypothetical protein
MVRELAPAVFVTCAHELIAKPGEYERTAATAINCFIGPGSSGYLERVQERAKHLGYQHPLLIMQASGGVATAREAAQKPVFTIGSGPVGGVIGSKFLADTLATRTSSPRMSAAPTSTWVSSAMANHSPHRKPSSISTLFSCRSSISNPSAAVAAASSGSMSSAAR